jgi:hypothetical protein
MSWFHHDEDRELREMREIHREVREAHSEVHEVLAELRDLRDMFRPRLTRLTILGGTMLEIGKTAVAAVQGLDQFGNPLTIDFVANPPAWTVDDPALASIVADPATIGSEDVTGVAVGTEVLRVTCAGFSAELKFDVVAPIPVLAGIAIVTNPPV